MAHQDLVHVRGTPMIPACLARLAPVPFFAFLAACSSCARPSPSGWATGRGAATSEPPVARRWMSDAAPLPQMAWQSRGVGGGGALFVPSISPVDDQLYMATDMAAVFHSADFGQTWTTVDFRQLRGGPLAQVRFTSDPNTLYALGRGPGDRSTLFESTNAGATFAMAGAPEDVDSLYLDVDPASTNRLAMSDKQVLRFSTNGGKTFRVAHGAEDPGSGIVLSGSFWDGQDIYLGTNDGLVVSHDGGTTFAIEPYGGIPADEVILSLSGAKVGHRRRFFAVTNARSSTRAGIQACEAAPSYRGVYRLDAGESAWKNVASGLPSGHHPTFVRMAENDVEVAYLAGSNPSAGGPAVSKTSDGGGSWVDVFRTRKNGNISTGWSGAGGDSAWTFGECAEGFAVARTDSKRAVLTDMGFVHRTVDGGASWQQAYVDPADENPPGADTPRGRAYRTSGVEQTSAWWLTWADRTTIFGSFTDITSVRSTNGGVAWARESQNGLRDNTTYQTVLHPSGTLYAATSDVHDLYMSYRLADTQLDRGKGSIMQSSDKGATWTTVHAFGHLVVSVALDPTDANSMYAAVEHSSQGGVFHTSDLSHGGSSSWTRLPSPPRTQGHPYNTAVLRDGVLVVTYSGRRDATGAFTNSSGVFVSLDHGATWSDRSDPGMHYWTKDLVIDPNDATESTWYVGVFKPFGAGVPGIHSGLFRTTDRGLHWAQLWDGHNVESCRVDPRDPQHLFVTTESEGLFSTKNLSAATPTFAADPAYPFAHPMRVFFNPHDAAEVWVTSFGGGLRVRSE